MNQDFSTFGLPRDFITTIQEYQSLEQKVSQQVVSVCRPFCSACSNCCCKTDFCSESLDSYWLRMTWRLAGHDRFQYDDSIGWLSSDGCRLTAGRPPVCYEYLCDGMIADIPADRLSRVKVVTTLLSSTGKNALGSRHLVTLTSEQILTRMNFGKLRRRIAKSRYLLQEYEAALPSLQVIAAQNKNKPSSLFGAESPSFR